MSTGWKPASGRSQGLQERRWRGEIVYVRGDTMMRVEVEIGATLQLGLPEPLFRSPIELQTPPTRNFDMLRDGRFIVSGRSDDIVDQHLTPIEM